MEGYADITKTSQHQTTHGSGPSIHRMRSVYFAATQVQLKLGVQGARVRTQYPSTLRTDTNSLLIGVRDGSVFITCSIQASVLHSSVVERKACMLPL